MKRRRKIIAARFWELRRYTLKEGLWYWLDDWGKAVRTGWVAFR